MSKLTPEQAWVANSLKHERDRLRKQAWDARNRGLRLSVRMHEACETVAVAYMRAAASLDESLAEASAGVPSIGRKGRRE